MIRTYKSFVNELYNVYQNDPAELASQKLYANDMENYIKEFLTKKVTLDNIYIIYKDEKDLISKLSAQKFIEQNTTDKKKIKFLNPLLGLYAQAAEKKRELKNIEKEISDQDQLISDRKGQISENPEAKVSLQQDINYTTSKINDLKSRLSKIKNEIVSLERSTEKKLKEMKSSFTDNKKRIDYFIKMK
jgi:chromosome segregation ATPase